MSLPPFPEQGSIPPVTFYTLQGLSSWLNQNPSYKQYFINYKDYFPYLYSQAAISELISTSQIPASSIYANYDIERVPLAPIVTTLSQYQNQQLRTQFDLFRRVYTHNSNAYVSSATLGTPPMYYRFYSAQERTECRAAVATMNRLYPFDAMMRGANENGSTLGWMIPFPLGN